MCNIDKVRYIVIKITNDGGFTVLAHAETEIAAHYALMDFVQDIGDTLTVCRVTGHYHVTQEMIDDVHQFTAQRPEFWTEPHYQTQDVRNN